MKITLHGKEYIKDKISHNMCEMSIDFIDSANESVTINIKAPIEYDSTFNSDDFLVFYLIKKDVLESDIYQIYDRQKDKRIGWIFPVSALDSSEHDYAHNEHFIRYANIAIKKIFNITDNNIFTNTPEIHGKSSFSFCDFFHDSTVLLVISGKTLDDDIFKLEDWLPSLSAAGYAPLTSTNPDYLTLAGNRPVDKRLYVTKVATELREYDFINLFYSNLIPYESHPLLLFFYCYQIIEVLLTHIFKIEQTILFDELKKPIEDGDVVKVKDIMSKISDINSEKARFSLLIKKYIKSKPSEDMLIEACNQLLAAVNKEHETTASNSIYKVRNFLFHQYHSVSVPVEVELINLNNVLLKYLSDLCSNFCLKTGQK